MAHDSGWSLPPLQQTVALGLSIAEALLEATRRLAMRRVAVVTTNSLAGPGGLANQVRDILGAKFHPLVAGIHPHSPRANRLHDPLLASNPVR